MSTNQNMNFNLFIYNALQSNGQSVNNYSLSQLRSFLEDIESIIYHADEYRLQGRRRQGNYQQQGRRFRMDRDGIDIQQDYIDNISNLNLEPYTARLIPYVNTVYNNDISLYSPVSGNTNANYISIRTLEEYVRNRITYLEGPRSIQESNDSWYRSGVNLLRNLIGIDTPTTESYDRLRRNIEQRERERVRQEEERLLRITRIQSSMNTMNQQQDMRGDMNRISSLQRSIRSRSQRLKAERDREQRINRREFFNEMREATSRIHNKRIKKNMARRLMAIRDRQRARDSYNPQEVDILDTPTPTSSTIRTPTTRTELDDILSRPSEYIPTFTPQPTPPQSTLPDLTTVGGSQQSGTYETAIERHRRRVARRQEKLPEQIPLSQIPDEVLEAELKRIRSRNNIINIIPDLRRQLNNTSQIILTNEQIRAITEHVQPERYNRLGVYDIDQDDSGIRSDSGITEYPRRLITSNYFSNYYSLTYIITQVLMILFNLNSQSVHLDPFRPNSGNSIVTMRFINMMMFNLFREYGFTTGGETDIASHDNHSFNLEWNNRFHWVITNAEYNSTDQQSRQLIGFLMYSLLGNSYLSRSLNIRRGQTTTTDRNYTYDDETWMGKSMSRDDTLISITSIFQHYMYQNYDQNRINGPLIGSITSAMYIDMLGILYSNMIAAQTQLRSNTEELAPGDEPEEQSGVEQGYAEEVDLTRLYVASISGVNVKKSFNSTTSSEGGDNDKDKGKDLNHAKEMAERDANNDTILDTTTSLNSANSIPISNNFQVSYLEGDFYLYKYKKEEGYMKEDGKVKLRMCNILSKYLKSDITWCFPRAILHSLDPVHDRFNKIVSDEDIFDIKYDRGSIFTTTSVTNEDKSRIHELIPLSRIIGEQFTLHQYNMNNIIDKTKDKTYTSVDDFCKQEYSYNMNRSESTFSTNGGKTRLHSYVALTEHHAFAMSNNSSVRKTQFMLLAGLTLYQQFAEEVYLVGGKLIKGSVLGQMLLYKYFVKYNEKILTNSTYEDIHYTVPDNSVLAIDKTKSRELINRIMNARQDMDNVEEFTKHEPSYVMAKEYKQEKYSSEPLRCTLDIETRPQDTDNPGVKDNIPYGMSCRIGNNKANFKYNGNRNNLYTPVYKFMKDITLTLRATNVKQCNYEEKKVGNKTYKKPKKDSRAKQLAVIGSHNGGKFDLPIIMKDIARAARAIAKYDDNGELRKHKLQCRVNTLQITSNSIINVKVELYYNDRIIKMIFRDTYRMIPMPLSQLAATYGSGTVKAPYNHSFINKNVVKNKFNYKFTKHTLHHFFTDREKYNEYMNMMKYYEDYLNNKPIPKKVPKYIREYYHLLGKKTGRITESLDEHILIPEAIQFINKYNKNITNEEQSEYPIDDKGSVTPKALEIMNVNDTIILDLDLYTSFYCNVDVDSLHEAMENFSKMFIKNFGIDPIYVNTQASLIKKVMFYKGNTQLHKYPVLTENALRFEESAVIGGQVHNIRTIAHGLSKLKDQSLIEKYDQWIKKSEKDEEYKEIYDHMLQNGVLDNSISVMDAVSLYPSAIILVKGLPAGKAYWLKDKNKLDMYKKILCDTSHTSYYLSETAVNKNHSDTITPTSLRDSRTLNRVVIHRTNKNPLIPMIPCRIDSKLQWTNDIKGLPEHTRTFSLGDIQLRTIINKHGLTPDDFTIKYSMVYEKLDYSVGKFLMKLFKQRQDAKKETKRYKELAKQAKNNGDSDLEEEYLSKAASSKALDQSIKLMMNSSYGQMIMKSRDTKVKMMLKSEYDKRSHNRDVIHFNIIEGAEEDGDPLGFITKFSKVPTERKGNEEYVSTGNHYGIGRCILDSSKAIMGKFHGGMEKYNELHNTNEPIHYTDTDSFYIPYKCCKSLIEGEEYGIKHLFSKGKAGEDKPGQVNCDYDGDPLISEGTHKSIGPFSIATYFCAKKLKCSRVVTREGIVNEYTGKGVPNKDLSVNVFQDYLDGKDSTFTYTSFRSSPKGVKLIDCHRTLKVPYEYKISLDRYNLMSRC